MQKNKTIKNMTGHLISVGSRLIEPDGTIRISFMFFEDGEIDGVPIYRPKVACSDELMPVDDRYIYVVSEKVCRALKHRGDLYTSYGLDVKNGKPVGAKGLKQNPYFSCN